VAISLQNLVSAGAEILLTHSCFQGIDFLKETEIVGVEVDSGDWDVWGNDLNERRCLLHPQTSIKTLVNSTP
jgi:hypothetical protein